MPDQPPLITTPHSQPASCHGDAAGSQASRGLNNVVHLPPGPIPYPPCHTYIIHAYLLPAAFWHDYAREQELLYPAISLSIYLSLSLMYKEKKIHSSSKPQFFMVVSSIATPLRKTPPNALAPRGIIQDFQDICGTDCTIRSAATICGTSGIRFKRTGRSTQRTCELPVAAVCRRRGKRRCG